MTNTDELIEQLAARAAPVARLKPPAIRALGWLAAYAVGLAIAVVVFEAWPSMLDRLQPTRTVLEFVGTALTGSVAVVVAFYLSVPDRDRRMVLLVVPPLLLWLASSGYGCLVNLADGGDGWARSSECFTFITALSVPLGLLLYYSLRRAVPLDPVRVLVAGGIGVAGLSAFALQFFHPFDVTVIDLTLHIVAVLGVIAAMTVLGRAGLRLPA